ncbi:MAG TPA: TrpB-like pyridoxal phosphate-dependent enzyme [Armatimonadota bacterium]|nr:TrpB-like pyridoxal phosphate-dependent enzyme [Armatimonadota bacterium]
MSASIRYLLPPSDMPSAWYNVLPRLSTPLAPPLNPATGQPAGPADLLPIFPEGLVMQEMCPDPWVDIPGPVLDIYRTYRPSPLVRAIRLEEALETPAHIYYKYEGVSAAGSHKPNTAIAQAYVNKQEGVRRLATETGAGQWGSALAHACAMFGLECTVYMVRVSYNQKPYRRSFMQVFGAAVHSSPSTVTEIGRKVLADDPDTPGSLGIAISEALEDTVKHEDCKYSLGSVLNHVLLHQTIIGLEAKQQLEKLGEQPDVVIGCHGGGSNFAGIALPFVDDKLAGRTVRLLAVEPTACPTLTRGPYAYDFGDLGQMTPLLKMHTLGHSFVPAGIHAGGLRYHGAAPICSKLLADGMIEAKAYPQVPVFDAAVQFARAEGLVPAPESAHAIRAVVDEALEAKELGEERVILFNLSGHGMFDLGAYDAYFAGELVDYDLPAEALDRALKCLPAVGG